MGKLLDTSKEIAANFSSEYQKHMEANKKKFNKQLSRNAAIMKVVQRIEALINHDDVGPTEPTSDKQPSLTSFFKFKETQTQERNRLLGNLQV